MADRPGPVLITGANLGIGLSAGFASPAGAGTRGARCGPTAKAVDLAAAAEKAGVADRVHPVVLDVADHDAIVAASPDLPDFYAVVNNAGYSEMGAVEEVSAAEAKAQLDVNLVAPAIVSACAFARHARTRCGAHRDGLVDVRQGRGDAAQRLVPRLQVRPRGPLRRPADGGRRVRCQGCHRRTGVLRTGIDARPAEKAKELAARESSPYLTAYERVSAGFATAGRFSPPPAAVVAHDLVRDREPAPTAAVPGGCRRGRDHRGERLLPRELTDNMARLMSGLMGPGAPRRR